MTYAGGTWTVARSGGANPPPVGSGDDVTLQAYITSMNAGGRMALVTTDGTYVLNNPITINGPILFGGSTQTFKASSTFPIGQPLFQTTSGQSLFNVSWASNGEPTFDCNGRACGGFAWNTFTNIDLTGFSALVINQNGTGGPAYLIGQAGQGSSGLKHAGTLKWGGGTTTNLPGSVGIIINASDCVIGKPTGGGTETGVWILGANNELQAPHVSNTKCLQCYRIDDIQRAALTVPVVDTPASVTHSAATFSNVSSTVTDTAIATQHNGIRVTGTGNANPVFVGTVTAGVSFVLVDNTGTPINAGSNGTGITLMPTGVNNQGVTEIVDIHCVNNGSVGGAQDNTIDVINTGPNANATTTISGGDARGSSNSFRVASMLVGTLTNVIWTGLNTQINVVNQCASRSGPDGTDYPTTASAAATPNATANTLGTAVTLSPVAGYRGMSIEGFSLVATGVATETITMQISVHFNTGGSQTVSPTATANGTTNSNATNIVSLRPSGNGAFITSITLQVKSTIGSSTASVTLAIAGQNKG